MDVREKLALSVCNATQKTNYKCEFNCEKKGKCAYCLVMAEQMIANGVTVQECGHWDIFDDGYGCELMTCSICKSEFYDGDNDTVDKPHNYCPHCGAKMMPEPPKGE